MPFGFFGRKSSTVPPPPPDKTVRGAGRKASKNKPSVPSAQQRMWRRTLVAGALLPLFLVGGACGAYYYRLHQLCESLTISGLPRTASLTTSRRVLVISPHCDDETLGAGGFIADCRRAGVPVTIAFVTNGDGFRVAASRTLREVSVGPNDFIRFAQTRQEESLLADRELGVNAQNVVFMGYPDRGLKPLWEDNWDETNLYRSAYTGHTRCPYPRAFRARAPYCGASLLSDMAQLMETVRPTDILVTHPADDHPDHSAASAFANAALTTCKMKGDNWAQTAHMRYYIVHRGDWPIPQGSHPNQPLTPPPGLLARDTQWSAYPVTHEGEAAKSRALSRYESQLGIAGRFLSSFTRTNELFADLPTPQLPAFPHRDALIQAERTAGGDTRPATGLAAFWNDATRPPQRGGGDNFARFADPATDLTGISLRRVDKDRVAIRINTRGPVSGRVRYHIALRTLSLPSSAAGAARANAKDISASHMVTLPVPVAKMGGSPSGSKNCYVEEVVSLESLGLQPENGGYVWAQAETRWANRLPVVDRTGYRAFCVPGEPNSPATLPEISSPADTTAIPLPNPSPQTGTNTGTFSPPIRE